MLSGVRGILLEADLLMLAACAVIPIPDFPSATMRLATVRSISGTAVKSENVRGSITACDMVSSVAGAFREPEFDGAYFATATASGASDHPRAGATRVAVRDKTAAGFTDVLEASPGPGSSVTVDWSVVR
jgi:hypothetical protein